MVRHLYLFGTPSAHAPASPATLVCASDLLTPRVVGVGVVDVVLLHERLVGRLLTGRRACRVVENSRCRPLADSISLAGRGFVRAVLGPMVTVAQLFFAFWWQGPLEARAMARRLDTAPWRSSRCACSSFDTTVSVGLSCLWGSVFFGLTKRATPCRCLVFRRFFLARREDLDDG